MRYLRFDYFEPSHTMAASMSVPAPFHDAAALQQAMQAMYDTADTATQLGLFMKFYGFSSIEEWMATPCSSRTGVVGTLKSEWFDLFPFVDLSTSKVEFEDLFVSSDGYTHDRVFWSLDCLLQCRTMQVDRRHHNRPYGKEFSRPALHVQVVVQP